MQLVNVEAPDTRVSPANDCGGVVLSSWPQLASRTASAGSQSRIGMRIERTIASAFFLNVSNRQVFAVDRRPATALAAQKTIGTSARLLIATGVSEGGGGLTYPATPMIARMPARTARPALPRPSVACR